ncbi:hypothetical protein GCM10028805_36750 [Spirosoma harenae]
MTLTIRTLTPQQHSREFHCEFDDLEKAYNFLLSVKQGGDLFLTAEFIDWRGNYGLPVEELNQGGWLNPFHQLKQQWEHCLAAPVSHPPIGQGSVAALKERLVQSQLDYRANLEDTLIQMLVLRESAQCCLSEGARKSKLMAQYGLTIDRIERSLARCL